MLLILTSEKDLSADFLIIQLMEKGLPYLRLNAEELHHRYSSFDIDGDGVGSAIECEDSRIDLKNISNVWYRRAMHPRVDSAVQPSQRSYAIGEIRHFWEGLVLSLNVPWVNPMGAVASAEHKLFQLKVAKELGFRVPRTIVSRDQKMLVDFEKKNRPVICKPIYHGLFIDESGRYSAYTRRIGESDLEDEQAIAVSPVLLQEEVKRLADIRVTFIGNEVFSVRIKSDDPNTVDWRKPGGTLLYEVVKISGDIEDKCRSMLVKLGLVYGAFDFIEDESGALVFLEVNPTGEWAWLEDQLGIPMRDAFVRLFYGGQS